MSHRFLSCPLSHLTFFFFFNDTAPTDIYTLSLHDALPICELLPGAQPALHMGARRGRVLLDQLSAGVLGSRDEVGVAFEIGEAQQRRAALALAQVLPRAAQLQVQMRDFEAVGSFINDLQAG